MTLKAADNSPKSALEGIPKFVSDGNLTPDFYAVNTMQPPYQPSGNKPAQGGDPAYADPTQADDAAAADRADHRRPAERQGRQLGLVRRRLAGRRSTTATTTPVPNFQYPPPAVQLFRQLTRRARAARAEHLRDGGLDGVEFIKAIDAGKLPQVTFYKPQGNLNEHSGYADVQAGDQHIADVIAHLEKSPQWAHMLVVVTYDENGGFWDHVAPPKGDRWGPGSRIPAIIVSPFAKQRLRRPHAHTTRRRSCASSPAASTCRCCRASTARDEALAAHGEPPLGDLTDALETTPG